MKKYKKQNVIMYSGKRIPHMIANKKNIEKRSRRFTITNIFHFLFLSFSVSVLLVANERNAVATFLFI